MKIGNVTMMIENTKPPFIAVSGGSGRNLVTGDCSILVSCNVQDLSEATTSH